MSLFAEYSHPERVPQDRHSSRVEYLRDLQRDLANRPDPLKMPLVACPLCGIAIELHRGRNSGKYLATHTASTCADSGSLWRLDATEQAAAVAEMERRLVV